MQVNEKLLHYIWQFQLFNRNNLETSDGQTLTVFNPGAPNQNQGPDFLTAKIKIEDSFWVGNIEIHVNASDWIIHQHDSDLNYKNVILHVVWRIDQQIDLPFPTLVLENIVPKIMLEKYNQLLNQKGFIPCEKNITQFDKLILEKLKERMLVEKLQLKAESLIDSLKAFHYNWEEISWQLIARNFGIIVNADAFEEIAKSISINLLFKHSHSLFQLEALLFGQSGLLNKHFKDAYPNNLFKEYLFLRKKYQLKQPKISIKFLRMRPANFPTVRLAQLAALLHQKQKIFSSMVHEENIQNLYSFIDINVSDYWNNHYVFDKCVLIKNNNPGMQLKSNIIINTAVVLSYTYGSYYNFENYKNKSFQWLIDISAEKNFIYKSFLKLGFTIDNAYDSQAMIFLKLNYCDHKKCLDCTIGNQILKTKLII
jgi:hypothetical protein